MKKLVVLVYILSLLLCSCSSPDYNPSSTPSEESKDVSSQGPINTESDLSGMDFTFTDRELSGEYTESGATKITLSGSDAQISGSGASAINSEVVINSDGVFILSGSAENVMIKVCAGDSDKVQLVFDGVSIKNSAK